MHIADIAVEVANGDCFALYESFDKMPDPLDMHVEFVEVLPLASHGRVTSYHFR